MGPFDEPKIAGVYDNQMSKRNNLDMKIPPHTVVCGGISEIYSASSLSAPLFTPGSTLMPGPNVVETVQD